MVKNVCHNDAYIAGMLSSHIRVIRALKYNNVENDSIGSRTLGALLSELEYEVDGCNVLLEELGGVYGKFKI